jgi:hypothetical protein
MVPIPSITPPTSPFQKSGSFQNPAFSESPWGPLKYWSAASSVVLTAESIRDAPRLCNREVCAILYIHAIRVSGVFSLSYFIATSYRGPLLRLLDAALDHERLTRVTLVQVQGRGKQTFALVHEWGREELDEGAYSGETILTEIEDEHTRTGKYELRYYVMEDDPADSSKERERNNPLKRKVFAVAPERGQTRSGSTGSDAASEKMAASMAGVVDKMSNGFMSALEQGATAQTQFLEMLQSQHDKEIQGSSEMVGDYMDLLNEKHAAELELQATQTGLFGLPPEQGLEMVRTFGGPVSELLSEVVGLVRAFRGKVDRDAPQVIPAVDGS